MSRLKEKIASTFSGVAVREEEKPATRALDIIIIGSIVLIFLLIPLFFTGLVVQGMGFEKMILFYFLCLLGIVAWVTKGVIRGELEFKRTPFDWPILALLTTFIVSAILSISLKDSLIGAYGNSTKNLAAVIIFVLFYYLVVNNINIKRIKLIFWALATSSSLIIVYSLLQLLDFFILPMDFTRLASFNPIGSLSGLTAFIVITLPLLVIATTQIKEIHPKLNRAISMLIKIAFGLITLAGFVILAFLNGFTFWPAAIVGIVIVLMFFLSKIISVTSNNLVIPLASFLLIIILLVLGNFNIIDKNLPAEVSLSRSASWEIAKNNLIKDPVFGSGPATFYYSFSKFKGADFNSSPLWNVRFDSASGILFELLAAVGSLGTLAFLVIILISLPIIFLALIKTNIRQVHSILLGLFASSITILIFVLLFSVSNALLLISVLISILTVSSAIALYPERFKSIKLSFRASPKYALALAAIFLFVSAGVVVLFTMGLKMYLADIYAKQSLLATGTEEKIIKLNKSIALFPYQDSYYINLANRYMDLANQEATGGGDQAKIENSLSQAIEAGKKALEISPNKAVNNESLALIYENASFYTRGALEWSENLYNSLAELEPDSPVPSLRIALVNMARANAEEDEEEKKYYINEAIKKYDEAIAKKNDLSSAHYGKAIAFEQLGDNNEAIEQLKEAVILTRNNIDYRFELARLYFNRGVTQPNLSQTATKELIEGPEAEEGTEELSVATSQPTGATVSRNDDLTMAEQIFLSILQLNPNHANALYSLALFYQKIGEGDNAKIAVQRLLDIIDDEATKEVVKQQFPGLY